MWTFHFSSQALYQSFRGQTAMLLPPDFVLLVVDDDIQFNRRFDLFYLQVKPILTVEPSSGYLFNAKWSPSRPLVFYLATSDGKLLIYDLKVKLIFIMTTTGVQNL